MPRPDPLKFQRNTIREAVCEIRLLPSPEAKWSPTRPGPLYKELMDSFPTLEPISEGGELEIRVTPQGPVSNIRSTTSRIQFKSEDGHRSVTVSDRVFLFSVHTNYTNWPEMKSQILQNWHVFSDHAQPIGIARIGMRYINKIPRPMRHPYVRDWLVQTDFIPRAVLDAKEGFVSRVESRHRENYIGIVTIAGIREDEEDFTLYDIDMIATEPPLANLKDISDTIETLHQDVERQFLSAQAERFTKYLEGACVDDL